MLFGDKVCLLASSNIGLYVLILVKDVVYSQQISLNSIICFLMNKLKKVGIFLFFFLYIRLVERIKKFLFSQTF